LLPPVEAEAEEAAETEAREGEARHRPATVLLVEDDEMIRELARGALARCGHTVLTARDGEEALAAVARWRNAFIRMPFFREIVTPWGVINDTFETAITWDRFREFHEAVMTAARRAIQDATGKPGIVTCRFTHVYPDGPAPYYTVLAKGRRGDELAQWGEIKAAASEAILRFGGTITHHHAVGRDHRPWYDRQRPDLFARALGAAKRELDPGGIMNPGVLLDPQR